MKDLCEADVDSDEPSDVFVACFSTEADDLSQWRGYSGGEGGFAIGFGCRALLDEKVERADRERYWPLPCVYSDGDIAKLAKTVVHGLKRLIFNYKPDQVELANEIFEGLRWAGLSPKHAAFEHEREWRLCAFFKEGDKVFFRSTPTLKPYLEYPFAGRLPIEKVMIGPQRHQARAKQSVEQLLSQEGLRHVEVISSIIPFRQL